jgi:two-component system, NtrC family, sensor histidine kinase PilS
MPATPSSAPSDFSWRVLGLLNIYRLLVPLVLVSLQWLVRPDWILVAGRPSLLMSACVAYFTAALLLIIARRIDWVSLRIVTIVNAGVDSLAIGLILYASGGVASGLGILLVLPVAALSILADHRDAFLIAAVAALAVLVQQIFVALAENTPSTDYTAAGVLGLVLFGIAVSLWPIANRLKESEALVLRQEIDLANLAHLSQYIVQHLRESILVVDTADRIRLINESAAQMLGDDRAYPDVLLGEASPQLMYLLETWRQDASSTGRGFPDTDPTFVSADGGRVIRAHFAPLGATSPAPVIVFLEDTSLLAERVQQSKLAALGRLSASIAHEIRNPVGAMSHAGQLLGESPHISAEDRRLTEIIRTNAERVSGIINNVLRLSKREATQMERLSLQAWCDEFHEEFCETMQWPAERLRASGASTDIEVRADPSQLRQIVWNLCENALKHGVRDNPDEVVELRYGRMSPTARPFLEIADRGPGVPPEHADRIFEPFFSGGRGTGLGLFLARELAQTNGATLLYEARPGGGSIFRLVFADPRRWEA